MKPLPSKDELHKLFEYRYGQLWWRDRYHKSQINNPAGYINGQGYFCVEFKNKQYLSHRIIYAMFYCDPCNLAVDHINGIPTDNRIENLRAVTTSINQQNRRKARSDSKSGLIGASFDKTKGKFKAGISLNGKRTFIGYFSTPEEAHTAYIDAKRKHHEGCTI